MKENKEWGVIQELLNVKLLLIWTLYNSSNCPCHVMFCEEQRIDGKGLCPLEKKLTRVEPGLVKQGIVEG